MNYRNVIRELEERALHPREAIAGSMRETGREAIGCFPVYTPEELVYAAGYLPVGMWGGRTELQLADRYLQSFCCSIMRSNMEYGLKGAYDMLKGVLVPTFCDTLKCIAENWKAAVPHIPVIPVVYPQNRNLDVGIAYAKEEFKRVRDELKKLGGNAIRDADMEDAWKLYEDYRKTMREFVRIAAEYPRIIGAKTRHLIIKAGYFSDKKTYIEEIRHIIRGLAGEEKQAYEGIKAVATGLISEPVEILQILEDEGVVLAADDLAHGSRQFRTPGRQSGDVWRRMAMRVADQRGDTFLYEAEKSRGKMLVDMVREKNAQAVVVFMMKFCDPEEFDYPIYKEELEEAGIPILYLEVDQQMDSFEQIKTRVQSFCEMLT